MNKTVYWANALHEFGSDITVSAPSCLLTEFRSMYKGSDIDLYLRCPAAINDLKNTFVVRAPFDFEIEYKNNTIVAHGVEDNFNRQVLVPLTPSGVVICIGPGIALFSEESLEVTQLPAFYHKTPFKDVIFTTGTYDISKWLRPIVSGVLNPDRKSIKISRGDVLYYLKFNTLDNVKLKKFMFTDKIKSYCSDAISLKRIIPNKTLSALYSMFISSKRRNMVLKEIKENLIE